jgi:hypothetical protein
MIDKNKTYKTRDGREVRIYATDGGQIHNTIHGAVLDNGCWCITSWDCNGRWATCVANWDLIEVRPRHKRTVWLNVYKGSDHGSYYDTKLDADADTDAAVKHQRWPRIACIKVELDYEEGQGL